MSQPFTEYLGGDDVRYHCPYCDEWLDKFDEICVFCGEEIEWDEVEDDE